MKPGYTYNARVVYIVDADTVDVDVDLGLGVWMHKQRLRLFGIDAWETRGVERPEGLLAKNRVKELLPLESLVVLETIKDKTGKYGRWLAIVHFQDEDTGVWVSLNDLLLDEGHATPTNY